MERGRILDLFLLFILGASLLPTAFGQWFGANTEGWPTVATTVWPIIAVVGMIILIYDIAKGL